MKRAQLLSSAFLTALVVGTVPASAASAEDPTFNKDVLPILQTHCQVCHRAGEVAPMSLMTYSEVRPWAKTIKTAVSTRKMPPWTLEPEFDGHVSNARRLSPTEIHTVVTWVDSGAREGDAKDKPTPMTFRE